MGQQPAPEAPGPRPVPEPDAPGTAPRVNALAYPSPSTGLYILLVAALTSVGAFAGSWLFNQVRGREWVLAMEACSGDAAAASGGPPGTGDPLRYQDAFVQCTAALERQRGLWFVAGALAVAAAAVALLWVVPVVLTRRHRLRPLPEALAPVARRADGLAAEAGVRRRPRLVVGASGLPDAFTFGTPGSYRVALPPKLLGLLARPGPADGVLRHEYAHVAHRDVELAWLARCAWYVVLPVLLVPVVGAFVSGDLSLLGAYVWRAAIVAAVVELVAARNLRAREHDADLRASALDAAGMARTLALLRARPDDSRPAGARLVRRLRARHPAPERRRAVLAAPHTGPGTGPVDGLAAGFLAALASPLLVQAGTALFTGASVTLAGYWTAAAVTGPLLGATIGFGVWRAELVAAAARSGGLAPGRMPRTTAGTALGVAAGLVLGQLVSLGQLGDPLPGAATWGAFAVPVLCAAGATAVVAGLAAVWAPAASLLHTPRPLTGLGFVTAVAVFTVGSWAWGTLQFALEEGGWDVALLWLATGYGEWPAVGASAAVVLLVVLGLALRRRARGRPLPAWAYAHGAVPPAPADPRRPGWPAVLLSGAAVGIVGALVQYAAYASSAPVVGAEASFIARAVAILLAGTAWAVAVLAASAARIAGAAPLAGALAAALSLAGFAAARAADVGAVTSAVLLDVVGSALGVGFVAGLAAAGAASLVRSAADGVARLARAAPAAGGARPAGVTG